MKLFANKEKDYTVIIGCGHLGSTLATDISDRGRSVLIIDRDEDAFRKLSLSPFSNIVPLTGDGTDMEVLNCEHIDKALWIVIVTGNDNTNIMIAQMVKEILKKDCVIAGVHDPQCECLYHEFGIRMLSPTALFANEVCNRLMESSKEAM